MNNPISFADPDGLQGQDWVQRQNGTFYNDPDVHSPFDAWQQGLGYIGNNQVVKDNYGRALFLAEGACDPQDWGQLLGSVTIKDSRTAPSVRQGNPDYSPYHLPTMTSFSIGVSGSNVNGAGVTSSITLSWALRESPFPYLVHSYAPSVGYSRGGDIIANVGFANSDKPEHNTGKGFFNTNFKDGEGRTGDVMAGVFGVNYSSSKVDEGVYHRTFGLGFGVKSFNLVPSPVTFSGGHYGSYIIGQVVPTGIPTLPFIFVKF